MGSRVGMTAVKDSTFFLDAFPKPIAATFQKGAKLEIKGAKKGHFHKIKGQIRGQKKGQPVCV